MALLDDYVIYCYDYAGFFCIIGGTPQFHENLQYSERYATQNAAKSAIQDPANAGAFTDRQVSVIKTFYLT